MFRHGVGPRVSWTLASPTGAGRDTFWLYLVVFTWSFQYYVEVEQLTGKNVKGTVARAGLSETVTENQQCGSPATVNQSQPGAVITFQCDPSVTAKYVSLDIDSSQPIVTRAELGIAEVVVKNASGSVIPLQGRPTSQSTNAGDNYVESMAIDGKTETWSETISEDNPWWRLDLGDEHCIGRVNVTLREALRLGHRFIDAIVRAGVNPNHLENQQCGSPATEAQSVGGATVGFMCEPPVKAKYVSVDISRNRAILAIAEVTVEEYNGDVCLPKVDNSINYPEFMSAYYNRLYKGSYIGNPDPLSTEVAWNLKMCAAHCVVHDLCYIFDFAPRTGKCHLYKLLDNVIPIPDSDFYIYELAKCLSELSICKN